MNMSLEKDEVTRLFKERNFRGLVKYIESFSELDFDWEVRLNLLRGTNNSDDFSDKRLKFGKELVEIVLTNPELEQISVL